MKVEVSIYKNQELVERKTFNSLNASYVFENKYRSRMTMSQWIKDGWAVFRRYPSK